LATQRLLRRFSVPLVLNTEYLSSYGVLSLPTAFTFTAVQFSLAALKRRPIVSYLGSYSRRGPFALYALSRYIGKDRVDDALRSLLKKHGSGAPPLPTSLDLYRELQAVTPDSYQYLLRDLFEKNTIWEFETQRATAQQTEAGAWQVTLDVRGRKIVVDEAGVETDVPMDDWIEVGVFDEGEPYLQKHRIGSGKQTITVTVQLSAIRSLALVG
jgi:hypothetical protein